jgi:hypothetical protein
VGCALAVADRNGSESKVHVRRMQEAILLFSVSPTARGRYFHADAWRPRRVALRMGHPPAHWADANDDMISCPKG